MCTPIRPSPESRTVFMRGAVACAVVSLYALLDTVGTDRGRHPYLRGLHASWSGSAGH